MGKETWAIMDDTGIIYSGSENGMRGIWTQDLDYIYKQCKVKGDLRLIEIHEVKN